MTTSTTTAPVEPGTTYPMPPAPVWATETTMEEGAITHQHRIGPFTTQPSSTLAEDDGSNHAVYISRWDMIDAHKLTVGETFVLLLDAELSPTQARVVAAVLIVAADLVEQS